MRKARILMVEDETDVLYINKKHLEKEGWEVIGVSTIHEAKNCIWENPPDVILLDIVLPDGSGKEFCRELHKTTTAPVIFLTCMDQTEHVVEGFSFGGDDYITKPYNLDILSARIQAQLRRSGFYRGDVIELPPLSINLHTGKVSLDRVDIILSQKEIQLLAFFAQNAGREFSTEEIYRAVWGEEFAVATHTVRVHISNLRNKLKLDDTSPFELTLTSRKKYIFLRTFS